MIAQHDIQHFRPISELMPASWHSGDIPLLGDAHIHYTRTGDGSQPAVLLLHGIQASGAMWLRTAQAFAADYDVILPDFRGHGQSSRITDQFSPDLLVADTVALLDALGVANVIVVGHSLGADIAGRLAAAHPKRVRGVMLVDPALRNFAAGMPDGEIPLYMEAIFQTMRKMTNAPHAEKMALALRLLPPGTPLWDEADYVTFAEGMAQFDQNAYRFVSRLGYLFEESTTIARIPAPLVLLTARPMLGEVNATPFTDHWRSGQHIHFPDSGHFIMFDQFERFIETLQAFLAG